MPVNTGVPLLAALALAACGSPGRVDGTIDARPVPVASAVLLVPLSTSAGYGAVVELSDRPGLCEALERSVRPGDELYVRLELSHRDGEGDLLALDVGDYELVAPGSPTATGTESRVALVRAGSRDAKCQPVFTGHGASGRVKLRAYSATAAQGTFTIEGTGLSLAGEFSADRCAQVDQSSAPTCR